PRDEAAGLRPGPGQGDGNGQINVGRPDCRDGRYPEGAGDDGPARLQGGGADRRGPRPVQPRLVGAGEGVGEPLRLAIDDGDDEIPVDPQAGAVGGADADLIAG